MRRFLGFNLFMHLLDIISLYMEVIHQMHLSITTVYFKVTSLKVLRQLKKNVVINTCEKITLTVNCVSYLFQC